MKKLKKVEDARKAIVVTLFALLMLTATGTAATPCPSIRGNEVDTLATLAQSVPYGKAVTDSGSVAYAVTTDTAISDTASSSNSIKRTADYAFLADVPMSLHQERREALFRSLYVGVPLIVGGFVIKGEDTHFRKLRNDYMPFFRRKLDNYLQLTPAAVMLALKTFGVESRSSWGRILTADAFSVVLMAGVVNSLKHTTNVMRPDGTDKHSFPSGHTATAFMAATMLTKEYGHRSPWVGIGAYSVAAATGFMRVANNKHWLSDVMTGAGIGIITTEMGYLLTDLIFRDHGLNARPTMGQFSATDNPSFLGIYLGSNIPLSKYDIDENHEFRTSSGSTAGLELAYFWNTHVGIGGRAAFSSTSIIVNGEEAEDKTFDAYSFAVGPYFSWPLGNRWLVGTKLLGEYVRYPRLKLRDISVEQRGGIGVGTGLSLTFKAGGHYGLRLFMDYDLHPSHSHRSGEYMNRLTPGISFVMMP